MTAGEQSFLFEYEISVDCFIGDEEYEINLPLKTNTQFRIGDSINVWRIFGLDPGLKVTCVDWYLDEPNSAFVMLEELRLEGTLSDWPYLMKIINADDNPNP